jgi:Ribonuclease G/E
MVVDEGAEQARLAQALGRERVMRGEAFEDALESEIALLDGAEVPLGGGGRLLISPLPALTAVDVDSGGAAPVAANRAALSAFARQVKLRDLAGPILLDLAGLSVKQRAGLEAPLRAALAEDGLAQLLGLGPLGLFELRRARIHPPLHEVLADRALAHGLALLRRAAREAAQAPHRRLALHAPGAVLEALRHLPGALGEYEAAAGHAIALRDAREEEVADA